MTEIPEHLLKRSKERRAAMGLPTDGGDAPAAAAPATTTAATPAAGTPPPTPAVPAAPAAPPPPKPDPHYVAAAKRRRRIPFWAMTALSILPLWAFMYVRSLTPAEQVEAGPIGEGLEVYTARCVSCHAADGSGGSGRPLNEGSALATFPHIEDQLNFVYAGSQAFQLAGIEQYGDPNREGGAHTVFSYNGTPMPGWGGAITDAEILAAVCHVRYDLSGADSGGDFAEEYEKWCSPESEIFAGLQAGSLTFDSEELRVGTEPRPALPSGE